MGVAIIVGRGVAQSVVLPGDIVISTSESQYSSGETVRFDAKLSFATGEMATTTSIALIVDGSQSLNVAVPFQSGVHDLTGAAGVIGNLLVTVDLINVNSLGDQFIGVFKGIAQGASIDITAEWTPDQATAFDGDYQVRMTNLYQPSMPFMNVMGTYTLSK